jgi:hypothetical protein
MPSLLTGTIAVKSITAKNGEVNLLTDKRGNINYEVFREKKGEGKNVRLKNISAIDIRAVYNDRSSAMRVSGRVDQATLGGEIFRTGIFLNTALNAVIDSVSLEGSTFRDIPLEAGIKLRKSANSLSVAKGSLAIADLRFEITGNVNYSSSTLNLTVEGKKISIASLASRLPDNWRAFTGSFSPVGIIDLKCAISGPYGEAGKPHIEMTYGLSGGKMSHSVSGFRVNNLEFNGALTNGDQNSRESFRFTIDNLKAGFGSASVSGSFMLNNLNRPHINLLLSGDLDFDDLGRVFRSGYIEDQTGSVSGSIHLSGIIPDTMSAAEALPYLRPEMSLLFTDFGASLAHRQFNVSDVNGSIAVKNDLIADTLSFSYREQHFTVNAVMRNFIPWISGRPEKLEISGDIIADRLVLKCLFRKKLTQPWREAKRQISSRQMLSSSYPNADSLIFRNFRAASFSGRLTYKPYVITLDEARADGLDGTLSGNLMLSRQKEGGFIIRTGLEVKEVDINKAFTAFNNFGQDFIVSDNLQGKLTGNVTMLSPLDGNYRFFRKAIVAEAHLQITEGKLVGFGPAESLSSYLILMN